MTRMKLQQSIGLFVMFGHIFLMLLVIYYYIIDGLRFEEMATALALISPMFAVYTTAIVRHFVRHRYTRSRRSEAQLNVPYIVVSFVFPAIYLGLVFLAIKLRANRLVFTSFDQFTAFLGIIESIFGLYVAQSLESLFDIERKTSQAQQQETDSPKSKS